MAIDEEVAPGASATGGAFVLSRQQARRLRELYRSAGWPSQDNVEIELLAAGMLARVPAAQGHEKLRLTDAGVAALACALQKNKLALSAHEALVQRVARMLQRDGRIVWTGLSVRARLPSAAPDGAIAGRVAALEAQPGADNFDLRPGVSSPGARWRVCKPDVFSIRNTSVAAYLVPVVHEIKVSRADLLGDLRQVDKRDSYLDLGGQCWYVLGCDARGQPIAQLHEVPAACGVVYAAPDGRFDVARHAPTRPVADLPFAMWMALAKAAPLPALQGDADSGLPDQLPLAELPPPPAP